MRSEHGKIEGDVRVEGPMQLYGMVTGNILVASHGSLQLFGTCCGNLTLDAGSEVRIDGTVSGNVLNRGGVLSIYGVVSGKVDTSAGETEIDSKSIIRGRVTDTRQPRP